MADQNPVPESDEIGKQLDALLAQVGDDDAAPGSKTDSADEHGAEEHVEEELAGDMLPAEDLIGNDLAEQIQQMLDDAERQQQAVTTTPAPTTPAATDAAKPETPTSSVAPAPLTPAPAPAPAAVAAKAPVVQAAPIVATPAPAAAPKIAPAAEPAAPADVHAEPAEHADLSKIDQAMAEGADDAIAGDFETVHDVLAAEQGQAVAPNPAPVAPPAPVSPSSGFAATAADVGKELDTQSPKATGAAAAAIGAAAVTAASTAALASTNTSKSASTGSSATAAQEPENATPAPVVKGPGMVTRVRQRIASVKLPSVNPLHLARWTCAIINAPLNALTPTARNTIGYVGLLTLFNASVLLMGKGASTLMGHQGPGTETTQNAHLEPPDPEAASGHGKPEAAEGHKTETKKAEPAKSEHGAPAGEAKKSEGSHDAKPKAAAKPEKSASKPADKKSKPASGSSSEASHGSGH